MPDAASPTGLPTTFGGDRPVELRVPAGYDASRPAPLLLVLHGYGAGGAINDGRDVEKALLVGEDGTVDKSGKRFWNANDGCCNFDGTNVDDVGYLLSLVKDIRAAYSVDPKRIFVMGHSNGGYMTNRLACDHAETFAAAVSRAGANWSDPARCAPTSPIGFLQMHGTKDVSVPYGPGTDGPTKVPHAGAVGTVATWATKNGCSAQLTATSEALHVSEGSPAADTKVSRHEGCLANGAAVHARCRGCALEVLRDARQALINFGDRLRREIPLSRPVHRPGATRSTCLESSRRSSRPLSRSSSPVGSRSRSP